jgi:uncharacterized membrane protein
MGAMGDMLFGLLVGALLGFALTPFATPYRAIVAAALAVALIVSWIVFHLLTPTQLTRLQLTRLHRNGLLIALFIAAFGVIWLGLHSLLLDHVPLVTYSLKALTADEAVPFLKGSALGPNETF